MPAPTHGLAAQTVRVALLYAAFYLLLSGTAVGGQEEIQALEYVRLDLSDGKIDGMSGNETIHDQFGVDKSSKSSIRNPFGRFAPKQGRFHYGKLVQAMPATSSAIDATKEYAHRAKVHAQAHEIGLPKHNGREEEPDAPIWQPEHDVSAAELPGDKMVERSRSVTFASEEPVRPASAPRVSARVSPREAPCGVPCAVRPLPCGRHITLRPATPSDEGYGSQPLRPPPLQHVRAGHGARPARGIRSGCGRQQEPSGARRHAAEAVERPERLRDLALWRGCEGAAAHDGPGRFR